MTRSNEQVPLVVALFITGVVSCFLIGRFWDRAKDAKSRASGKTLLVFLELFTYSYPGSLLFSLTLTHTCTQMTFS